MAQITFTNTGGITATGALSGSAVYSNGTQCLTGISSAQVTGALGYTPADNANLANYLPLNGGSMNGTTGIEFPVVSSNNKPGHFISAGGGYSTNSGKNGIKIVTYEDSLSLNGLGQDFSSNNYDLSIATTESSDETMGYISFYKHKMATPKSYTRLGYFDNKGDFTISGKCYIANRSAYMSYNSTTESIDFNFS